VAVSLEAERGAADHNESEVLGEQRMHLAKIGEIDVHAL
jgi:hypothetical protein